MPSTRFLLALIWLCFVIRGAFYCAIFPVWEGFDEYAHFAYVQHIDREASLPNLSTNISREVEDSLKLAPLPWMMSYLPPPHLTHDQYWKLSQEERTRRQEALRHLHTGDGQGTMVLYEAQQPPLYYVLAAPLHRIFHSAPLVDQIWILRLAGLILAAFMLPLGFLVAREVLRNDYLALGAMALISAMPELMMNLCRVSNEPLAVIMAALVFLFTLRERPIALGVTLGLALLTKAYFLTAVPAALLILLARKRIRHAAIVSGIAAVTGGWIYWLNWRTTGSISGLMQDAALAGSSRSGLLQLIPKIDWWRAVDSTFLSHIWFGNWSFLQLRSWMYHFFALAFAIALIGLCRRLNNPGVRVLLVFYATFLAGLAYHVVLTFAVNGSSSSAGWYLYVLVVAEGTLLAAGLRPALLAALTACFAALEIFGTHFYLIPYYTGLTAHLPNGRVPALSLLEFNGSRILERLAINQPAFMLPPVIFVLWLLFLASTVAIPLLAVLGVRRARAIK